MSYPSDRVYDVDDLPDLATEFDNQSNSPAPSVQNHPTDQSFGLPRPEPYRPGYIPISDLRFLVEQHEQNVNETLLNQPTATFGTP